MLTRGWSALAALLSAEPVVFCLGLLPFAVLFLQALQGGLGPDPAEALMQGTGVWGIRLLVLVLLARPLAFYGFPGLFRYRRILGLLGFSYVSLHLLVFSHIYIGWSPGLLVEELAERPYVIVGFLAWCVLVPLAVTSTRGWRRRLGPRWRRLHRGVYGVVILACLHLWWLSRSDIGEALLYSALFGVLLGWRFAIFFRKRLRP